MHDGARLPISAFCSAVNFTYDALLLLQGDCSCDRDSRASIFPPYSVCRCYWWADGTSLVYSVVHEDPVACRRAGRAIKSADNLMRHCSAAVYAVYCEGRLVPRPCQLCMCARTNEAYFREHNFHGWGRICQNREYYAPRKFAAIRYMEMSWSSSCITLWQRGQIQSRAHSQICAMVKGSRTLQVQEVKTLITFIVILCMFRNVTSRSSRSRNNGHCSVRIYFAIQVCK